MPQDLLLNEHLITLYVQCLNSQAFLVKFYNNLIQ